MNLGSTSWIASWATKKGRLRALSSLQKYSGVRGRAPVPRAATQRPDRAP